MTSSLISRLRDYPNARHILIFLTLIITIAANLYGLFIGVSIVIPHLFYIPIILTAFFYPRRGVPFAVILSGAYLLMVAIVHPGTSMDIISAASRCVVFVIIAAVVSYLSKRVSFREHELKKAKEEWERTFDAVPDLIALIDKEHRILRVNKAMAKSLEVIPEQVAGRRCYEIVHGSTNPPFHCPHVMLLQDGKEHTQEIHEDNLGGDFLVTASPLFDAEGMLIGSVHIARDITERRQAEMALKEKTEELDQYFSTSLDLFCIADTQGYFRRLNPQWERSLGYTLAELEGKRFLDFVHPDDLPATLATIADLNSQKEVLNFTNRYRHKDSTYRWIEWRSLPKGELIFAAARDITDRKRAEEALRESEERYRTIIENIQDVYFRFDKDSRLVMTSPSAALTFGYASVEEMMGIPASSIWKDPGARVQMIETMRGNGGFVQDWEAEFVRKDGTVFWGSISGHLYTDKHGGYLGKEGIIRDITERKKLDEALQQTLKKLNMLSSITRHDILNQITGLRTYLEMSREDLVGTPFAEFVEKEDQAAAAIQRQIEFTKFYQDIGVNAPRWQDAAGVIREAVAELPPAGTEIHIGVANLELFADPLIVKVFFNLMENSLRHGERVSRMAFTIRETEAGLIITYRDNGVGIPADDKKKLFRKGFGKHTGLGLFLSREILAITGITITENGEPGTGVRFEISVPKEIYRYNS
jgi:PAS domain S-box-containing protein